MKWSSELPSASEVRWDGPRFGRALNPRRGPLRRDWNMEYTPDGANNSLMQVVPVTKGVGRGNRSSGTAGPLLCTAAQVVRVDGLPGHNPPFVFVEGLDRIVLKVVTDHQNGVRKPSSQVQSSVPLGMRISRNWSGSRSPDQPTRRRRPSVIHRSRPLAGARRRKASCAGSRARAFVIHQQCAQPVHCHVRPGK